MKNRIVAFTLGIMVSGLFAFSVVSYEVRKNSAEVDLVRGLYVFIHSTPTADYEYLGSYTPFMVPSTKTKAIVDHMIKKGTKKFPEATGIIFTDDHLGRVDLIKFKE